MRKYVKSDINSYSYTGSGFADDSIVLAHYTKGTNNRSDDYLEVSLIQDGFTCYVEVEDFYDEHTYYKEYRMSDIESALDDFNQHVKDLGGWETITMADLDRHLSEGYGKSIYDYLPGGFYDNLRKNSGRGVTGSTEPNAPDVKKSKLVREIIKRAKEIRDYFQYHNNNLNRRQEQILDDLSDGIDSESIYAIREAIENLKYNSKNMRSGQYELVIDLYDDFNLANGKYEGMGYPEADDDDDNINGCDSIQGSTKTRYMANMVSADSDMNKPLSRYMGARLMTQWTAMLNVIGAEESPDFEEYDQYFDGTLPECLDKLREYQRLIDDNGVDAYISLESMRGGNYFEGTISQICEDLLNRDYITEAEYYDYTDGFYR